MDPNLTKKSFIDSACLLAAHALVMSIALWSA